MMGEFQRLRRELEIEGQEERKKRLRALNKHEEQINRFVKRVLKDLQRELFPDAKLRKLEREGWCLMHQSEEPDPASVEGAGRHRPKKKRRVVYDIAVRLVPNHHTYATAIAYLECWRGVSGDFAVEDYPSSEYAPYATCDPTREALVAALIDLVRRYPPGR